MTTQELRELDAWLAEHVMGLRVMHRPNGELMMHYPLRNGSWAPMDWMSFTTDPAPALDVLKKCAEKAPNNLAIKAPCPKRWGVGWIDPDMEVIVNMQEAETLELAICLFAKQLFSQTTK